MFLSNLLTLPYRCPLCISYLHSQIWLLPTWLKHTVITVTSFKLLEAYFYNEYTTFPRKLHFIKWTFRKTLWGFYHTAKRTFSCWLAFGRALSMKMPSGKKARTLRLQNPFVFFSWRSINTLHFVVLQQFLRSILFVDFGLFATLQASSHTEGLEMDSRCQVFAAALVCCLSWDAERWGRWSTTSSDERRGSRSIH